MQIIHINFIPEFITSKGGGEFNTVIKSIVKSNVMNKRIAHRSIVYASMWNDCCKDFMCVCTIL